MSRRDHGPPLWADDAQAGAWYTMRGALDAGRVGPAIAWTANNPERAPLVRVFRAVWLRLVDRRLVDGAADDLSDGRPYVGPPRQHAWVGWMQRAQWNALNGRSWAPELAAALVALSIDTPESARASAERMLRQAGAPGGAAPS